MPKLPKSQRLQLDGPVGKLEALLEAPQETDVVGCAVVCHPHPLHGGTMQNKVAHTLARSFIKQDFMALRFNFRGVNESDGEFDEGRGELQDVFAAMDFLATGYPDLPLWLSGFSFGAVMAVHAAAERTPAGLVSIAPAVSRFARKLERQPDCPWLIMQGDQDELVDVDETISWVNDLDPGPELQILEGAEHFFHGKLVLLREAVQTFIAKHS
jgi:alpha/beta superfamily hydrolase